MVRNRSEILLGGGVRCLCQLAGAYNYNNTGGRTVQKKNEKQRVGRLTNMRFIHMVYFWLREDGGQQDAEKLAEGARRHLTHIPGVLRLEAGFPAGTDRDVVDNSYGVALLVEFAGAVEHDVYQDHLNHHRFIAECSPLWSRVQVYDTRVG